MAWFQRTCFAVFTKSVLGADRGRQAQKRGFKCNIEFKWFVNGGGETTSVGSASMYKAAETASCSFQSHQRSRPSMMITTVTVVVSAHKSLWTKWNMTQVCTLYISLSGPVIHQNSYSSEFYTSDTTDSRERLHVKPKKYPGRPLIFTRSQPAAG